MEGDTKRFQVLLLGQPSGIEAKSPTEENKAVTTSEKDMLQEKTEHYFKKLLSSVIKLPAHHIEADAPLENYGMDSVMVIQLTGQLEKEFGLLPKTLFFEYQTIEALSKYFLEAYRDQLEELLGIEEKVVATVEDSTPAKPVNLAIGSRRRPRFAHLRMESREEDPGP